MTALKSFTDIEQSKKLVEILPLESADMYYFDNIPYCKYIEEDRDYWYVSHDYILAWSLAALFNMIPIAWMASIERCNDGTFLVHLDDMEEHDCYADNPVDACYELILKLNERNLL